MGAGKKEKPFLVTFLSLCFFIIKLILQLLYDCSEPLGESHCNHNNGKLAQGEDEVQRIWREYFKDLYNID